MIVCRRRGVLLVVALALADARHMFLRVPSFRLSVTRRNSKNADVVHLQ